MNFIEIWDSSEKGCSLSENILDKGELVVSNSNPITYYKYSIDLKLSCTLSNQSAKCEFRRNIEITTSERVAA